MGISFVICPMCLFAVVMCHLTVVMCHFTSAKSHFARAKMLFTSRISHLPQLIRIGSFTI
jgi:hypothetical protein